MAPETSPLVVIHEAFLGSRGAVIKGAIIDETEAIARRQAGDKVVVCGTDLDENRGVARRIEGGAGTPMRQPPHVKLAGPDALPHFQQETPPPEGPFYETTRLKAKRS
jgi:hypothetical protein